MKASTELRRRRLTLSLSTLTLVTNIASLYLFRYISDGPYHIRFTLSLYSFFSAVLSVLGLVGSIQTNALLVTLFSNHLLLDALFIGTIPRLLLFFLLPSFSPDLCSTAPIPTTLHSKPVLEQPSPSSLSLCALSTSSDLWTWLDAPSTWDTRTCQRALRSLRSVVGVLVALATAAQWWCVLRVREYARMLGWREARRMGETDKGKLSSEKGGGCGDVENCVPEER